MHDVQAGALGDDAVTLREGRVQVGGLAGVMRINGYLVREIMESNPTRRFFVDEAYVMPWMTPHLRPRGLVMEFMIDPLDSIEEDAAREDERYWRKREKDLLENAAFLESRWPRRAYGMMRSSIAGLYAYHGLYDRAERAFLQAVRLSPDYPEPAFRLAVQVYAPQGRTEEALAQLRALRDRYPENTNYDVYIEKLSAR